MEVNINKTKNRKSVSGYLHYLVRWIFGVFKKPIAIRYDGYCNCTCADKCPLGKVGSRQRCTLFELFWNDVKVKKSI